MDGVLVFWCIGVVSAYVWCRCCRNFEDPQKRDNGFRLGFIGFRVQEEGVSMFPGSAQPYGDRTQCARRA